MKHQMLKYYRLTGTVTEYWKCWFEKGVATVQSGVIGGVGRNVQQMRKPRGINPDTFLLSLASSLPGKGFVVEPPNGYWDLEVCYPIEGVFGTDEQLSERYTLQDKVNNHLVWTENGECTGGDSGDNTLCIYCTIVDVNEAIKAVKNYAQEIGWGQEKLSFSFEREEEN